MKKTLIRLVSYLLVVAMVAAMPVVAMAAATDHVHTFSDKKVAATCDAQGYTLHTCTKESCGYSYKSDFVPSLHEWKEGYSLVKTEDGKDYYQCSSCSDTYTVKTGTCPNHNPQKETVIKATCLTNKEYSYSKCVACGAYENFTKTSVSIDHSFSSWKTSVEGTFSTKSILSRKCSECGYVETKTGEYKELTARPGTTTDVAAVYDSYSSEKNLIGYLPKGATFLVEKTTSDGSFVCIDDGNSGTDQWVAAKYVNIGSFGSAEDYQRFVNCGGSHCTTEESYHKDATCTRPTMVTKKCVTCQLYYEFTTTGSALGHKDSKGNAWNDDYKTATWKITNDSAWTLVKAPTETENGKMKRVCSVCGKEETNTTAPAMQATGHQLAKGIIKPDMLEIYDKTSSDKTLIGYAMGNCSVTIYGYSTDKTWAKVSETEEWWVKLSGITIDGVASSAPKYKGAKYYGTVKTGLNLAVRATAEQTGDELSTLSSGSKVAVYEVDSTKKWVRIDADDAKWVYNGATVGASSGYMKLKEVLIGDTSYSPATAKLPTVIATGKVTSELGVNIRKSADVQSNKLGNLANGTAVYIYQKKTVNGEEWGMVKAIKNGSTTTWKEITKADLEDSSNTVVNGWIALNYVTVSDKTATTTASTNKNTVVATGYVTSNMALRVRSSAKISTGNQIGSLSTGTQVEIYEIKNGWGRILYNGKTGWICLDYVNYTKTSSSDSSAAITVTEPNATVVNCSASVNVRNSASISGKLVCTIPVNTRVAVDQLKNGWGHISGKGWAYMSYIQLDAGAEEAIKAGSKTAASTTSSSEQSITTYTNIVVPASVTANTKVYAKGGDTSSKVLMEIIASDTFNVVDRAYYSNALWYKISQGDIQGWIKADTVELETFTGTVAATTLNVYEDHSVDSKVISVLGKGSIFVVEKGNANQYTEGVYAWAKIKTGGWIRLHEATLGASSNANYNPSYSSMPAISGSTLDSVTMYRDHTTSSDELVKLSKNTNLTILDWYDEDGDGAKNWGKVTVGQYTGWISLAANKFEQKSISGTAVYETVNLYKELGNFSDAANLQLVLRSGEKVTITERKLVGNTIWGRMVASSDKQKRELWGNLAGIQMAGQTTAAAVTTTTTTTTTTAATPAAASVSATTGTIVKTDAVNVRSAAGVKNQLVTTLKKGTNVTVYETKIVDGASWGRIDQGWVCMDYVALGQATVTTGAASGTTIMTTVPSGAIAVGYVSLDGLAIREGAGMGYKQVGSLSKASNVVVYEQKLTEGMIWGRIDQGWICTSYVIMTAVGSSNSGTAAFIANCAYAVNVRSTPSYSGALVGKILTGSAIKVYEQKVVGNDTWARTDIGWVSMQYVSLGSLPVA